MKFIKLYESFEVKGKMDIDFFCEKYSIKNYTINSDGTVDVDGNVNLFNKGLTKLPLKFGNVSGNFDCSYNQLITLEGGPKSVGGDFDCQNNELTTLEGCPKTIRGNFDCSLNKLNALEGCPQSVGRSFLCNNNQLTTLEGCPQSVGVSFHCSNNLLKDLYGFPEFFGDEFFYYNNIVSEILYLFNIKRLGKVIDLINEYGVIQQDGKLVILDRLEEVFYTLNLEVPKEINLKNYEVY